eukprot:14994850-Alexandrium_andersonii.AAC.1
MLLRPGPAGARRFKLLMRARCAPPRSGPPTKLVRPRMARARRRQLCKRVRCPQPLMAPPA